MTHPTTLPLPVARADRPASRPSSTRPWAVVGSIASLLFIGALTLAPRWMVAPLHGRFLTWTDAYAQPLLAVFPQADTEQVLNAVLFVPLGAALAVLLGRRLWPLAIVAAFAVSTAAEYAQLDIPGRVSDPHDIVWNTLGATVGAFAIVAVRLLASLSRRAARATRRGARRRR
jgi:hypothetical protein